MVDYRMGSSSCDGIMYRRDAINRRLYDAALQISSAIFYCLSTGSRTGVHWPFRPLLIIQFSIFNCQLMKRLCVLAPWRETFSRCDDRISLGVWSSCSARDLKASKAFRILFERSSNHQYFNAVAIALKQCCNVVEMSYLFNAPVILTETKNPINSSRMVQQIPHSVSE